VKPYLIDISDTADKPTSVDDTEPESYTEYKPPTYEPSTHEPPTEHEPQGQLPKRRRGRSRKNPITVYLSEDKTETEDFTASRKREVLGLIEKDTFLLVLKTDIPSETRIFNSRFVDEVKNIGTEKAYIKSRLVVQAYNDNKKHIVLTESLII
jgi:hypothetical protein